MIHKIESLISIGKFRNYNATGSVHFGRLTLLYGNNGGGKTTLTAVLRSLTGNDPEIIRKRISTGHVSAQTAQVIQDGSPRVTHTFGSAGWSIALPEIEIFDTHFINDNIYSGFDFNEDHKRQLHQFVIGAQGIAIQQQIEDNKSEKARLRDSISNINQQLLLTVGNNLQASMLNAFVGSPPPLPTEIAQLITRAEQAVVNANTNAVIQTLPSLARIEPSIRIVDFDSLAEVLATSVSTIQDNTLRGILDNHLTQLSFHGIDHPEPWLKTGFGYVSDLVNDPDHSSLECPFCKQDIDENAAILRSYAAFFNDEFNNLIMAITESQQQLGAINLQAQLQGVDNVISTNADRQSTWEARLPSDVPIPIFLCPVSNELLLTQLQNAVNLLTRKASSPTVAVSSQPLIDLRESLEILQTSINNYNTEVDSYNRAIVTFRAAIQSPINAQLEVDRLRRIEQRHLAAVDSMCNQVTAETQQLRTLEANYTQLVAQQQAAAITFLTDYQDRINHYLTTTFRTPFRIEQVSHISPQGRSSQSKIGYRLTIHGHPIAFDNSQPLCVREVLSDGDRSTIALAFFLSKLDIDPSIQDKILVFDDPLSSLDSLRKAYTVSIIKRKLSQMKQVIVLSHNEYFLFEISKGIRPADKRILRIAESFTPHHQSAIEECDLNELVKSSYFKQIDAIQRFQSAPDPTQKDSVVGWLRNVLETNLKFRFHQSLSTLGQPHTFSRMITHLDGIPVVFKNNGGRQDVVDKLNIIDAISWRNHHGLDSPLDPRTEIDPNTISDAEVNSYIVDTLDLIDNQL